MNNKATATLYYIFNDSTSGSENLTSENRFRLASNFYHSMRAIQKETRGMPKFEGIGIVVSPENSDQFKPGSVEREKVSPDGSSTLFYPHGSIEIQMFGDRAKQYLQNCGINLTYPN